MKPSRLYFGSCQLAFVLACSVGDSFALSYLRFVHANNWLAWCPGVGIAFLFASMVVSFVGYGLFMQHGRVNPTYFRFCLVTFILACCLGLNLAMTYLHLVHGDGWAAWKPGIGIAIMFASLLLSYIGCALSVQTATRQPLPSARSVA